MIPGPKASARTNLRLRRMLQERPPGRTYSQREIAQFCGIHHSLIQQIEHQAFKKLRPRLTGMLQ